MLRLRGEMEMAIVVTWVCLCLCVTQGNIWEQIFQVAFLLEMLNTAPFIITVTSFLSSFLTDLHDICKPP